jgi:aminopeptidase YwaD
MIYANIFEQDNENQYRSSVQIKDTLNTKDADNLMLYPNPTNEILYIEINNDEDINYFFEIADLSGRIVLREKIIETKTRIDVSKLAKGSYIYSIKNSEQIPLKTDKLIIM